MNALDELAESFSRLPGIGKKSALRISNYVLKADDEFVNYGEHFMYVVGEVKKGDYLTTSPIRGAAIVTSNPELAFAVVTEGRAPSPDVIFPVVGGCYASFLKK